MEITATNRMSASDLVRSTGNTIDFVRNSKTNNIFFTCGKIVGGISKKVKEAYAAGTLAIEQMEYAEVSRDGAPAVPVLMMKSTNNVVASFK